LVLFGLALTACSSQESGSLEEMGSDTDNDISVSTEDGTSAETDTSTSDTGKQEGTEGTGSTSNPKDTATGADTNPKDTGTGSNPPDSGTPSETTTHADTDSLGLCDVPNRFLDAPKASSYVLFNAAGYLNDPSNDSPVAADAFIEVQYKGVSLDFSAGSALAYYSRNGQRAYFKLRSAADTKGRFYYAEAKISVFDLVAMNAQGEHQLDLYDGEAQTTTRLYEGWQDKAGNIDKLCLLGVPSENSTYYACTTGIDYMSNVGEAFSMAGNVEIFDDTEYLREVEYAMCLCDNGAGSWRSCDPGIPDDYGRLRLSFRDGTTANNYFSKYVYDESKVWKGNALNIGYVSAHEAGMWRHTYSFMTGGLNILSGAAELGPFVYGFGEPIPYGSGVIGLVSHDAATHQIIVRQQSFATLDKGAEPVGLWLVAYVPDDVRQDDIIEFGIGEGTAKLFAYDPRDPSECIQAIACNTSARVQRATNLTAAEGGTFELRTEADDNGSTMSLRLAYPGENPACDLDTYLAQAGLPIDAAVCDKL
jgi:hypothetical protein